jgi:hypothetical protein
MTTYYLDDVFTDWTSGILIVNAKNRTEAMKIIKKKVEDYEYRSLLADHGCYAYEEHSPEQIQKAEKEMKNSLQVLKLGELVRVRGGG